MAAKLTKDVIKGIVKECLIEILAEGLSSNEKRTKATSKKARTLKEAMSSSESKSNRKAKMPKYLDNINNSEQNNSNLRENKRLNEIASSITDDPMFLQVLVTMHKDWLKITILRNYLGKKLLLNGHH